MQKSDRMSCAIACDYHIKSAGLKRQQIISKKVPLVSINVGRGYFVHGAILVFVTKYLQGDRDELRSTDASPIFGRHRVVLGCSGLHANCYFTAERNSPAPKNI